MTKSDTITQTERKTVRSLLGCQRLYLGMTRRQLSERSGVSVRTIRDYETDKKAMGNMGASVAVALCRALGITVDAIRFDDTRNDR
jgi:transcriptional regulator with XRE-family HTH domain